MKRTYDKCVVFIRTNMNLCITLSVLFALNSAVHSKEHTTTIRVDKRVRMMKLELERNLRAKHGDDRYIEPIEDARIQDYEDDDGSSVTPILERDEFKKNGKFRLKKLKTTPTTTMAAPIITRSSSKSKGLRNSNVKGVRSKVSKPKVTKKKSIFYRKSNSGYQEDSYIPWVHCSAMISPYFNGAKKELTRPKVVTKEDHVVLRLIQLLGMDTSNSNKDEVYSILYQISQLKIRVWSWDLVAMNMLFNVITQDPNESKHDFKTLKQGVKRLFASWKLDTSNTTRLLLQARVFRPPCLQFAYTGSSRFVRGSTIRMITMDQQNVTLTDGQEQRKVEDSDESPECQNRAHDHHNRGRVHQKPAIEALDQENQAYYQQIQANAQKNPVRAQQNPAHAHQKQGHVQQIQAHVQQNRAHVQQNQAHVQQNRAHVQQNRAHVQQNRAQARVQENVQQNQAHDHQKRGHKHQNQAPVSHNQGRDHQNQAHRQDE